jgi:hypothetical protein
MVDDVILNKAAAIERAVRRVREEYDGDDANLLLNQTRQDAIIARPLGCWSRPADSPRHCQRA